MNLLNSLNNNPKPKTLIKEYLKYIIVGGLAFLDESGNPRAMRVVMWTGYAGPEWVWP